MVFRYDREKCSWDLIKIKTISSVTLTEEKINYDVEEDICQSTQRAFTQNI